MTQREVLHAKLRSFRPRESYRNGVLQYFLGFSQKWKQTLEECTELELSKRSGNAKDMKLPDKQTILFSGED